MHAFVNHVVLWVSFIMGEKVLSYMYYVICMSYIVYRKFKIRIIAISFPSIFSISIRMSVSALTYTTV